MANYIEYTDRLNPDIYVVMSSRYMSSKVIYYGDDRKITFTTYKKTEIPQSEDDKFLTLTSAVNYRPDLVSQKVYFTPDYWWRIMEFNGMKDITEFVAGKTIRLPSNFS